MIKTNNNITSVTATTTPIIKLEMDRRISTTSESSVEPMDLGRTPTPKKKFHTKDINNDTIINNTILNNIKLINNIDSEENSYDSDEHENEYLQQQHKNNITTNIKFTNKKLHRKNNNNNNHHHHREKRIIQIEENDNPHSLRKKFRISTPNRNNNNLINHKNNNNNLILTKINNNNNNDDDEQQQHKFDNNITSINNDQQIVLKNDINNDDCCIGSGDDEDRTNNESGFVDTSGNNINSSPTSTSSSPESGIGERGDDVKYVCPICEIVSATPHEFTNHIRCHNYSSGDSENFTCRICSKVLSSASSLDRHVLVHTGERPFNCKYCHLTFTTNGNMHRHMRTHKQHQQQHHQRNNSNNNNNSSTTVTTNGNDSSGGGGGGIQNKTSNNNGKPIKDNKINNNNNNKMNISNNNNNNISGGSGNNSSSNGGESYESDGCSTDSSISADHVSNNIIINTTKNCNNNNNNIIINNNLNKRKSTDDFDNNGENILNGIIKRRIKTTINNNIINENDININTINNNNNNNDNNISKLCCPVCNRYDFINMLTLGTHMDREHSDIPAKCRECDVVFKTHKQLNGHRCCNNNNNNDNDKLNITHGFRDLTFVDFSSEKFPLIAKSLCEQTLRTSISNQKFECPKCFRQFPCTSAVDIHVKECYYNDGNDEILTSSTISTTNKLIASLPTILPHDFSMRKKNITTKRKQSDEDSESSIDDDDNDNNNNHNNDDVNNVNRNRDEFFAHLDLQNKTTSSIMSSPCREKSDYNKSELDKTPTKITTTTGITSNHHLNTTNNNNTSYHNHQSPSFSLLQQQQVLQQQQNDSKDLADIQSILNVTSSSSNNFLRNFENNVNTPSSECGYGKDEEEAQDAFTSEFRKMKLRGEFPCKLCTAVFPNLRALKGHNRIHISAAGAAGPFRCNMCPYSIHDKAALVRHMRSHNGDRPYECAVCNYAFTTKANCERHLRNRHAKTTREEVKRAIIYHPSEDSSCDDPTKKLHLFSSPEFDNDDVVEINPTPKDRSTPVSHLKEMLQNDNKPMKIQVKSLEKLLDKSSISSYGHYDDREEKELDNESQSDTSHPIDLSMDVLDLSKKSTKVTENKLENDNVPEQPKIDMDLLQKNHQILLAQQQFLSENLPKIDSAQYFQFSQLCNNLVFPQLHPAFFLQNTFLPNNLADFNKFAPLLTTGIFGNPPAFNIPTALNVNIPNQQLLQPQEPQSPTKIFENPIQKLTTPSPAQLLPKSLTPSSNQLNITQHLSPTEQSTQAQQQQQQQQPQTKQMPQPIHNNNNNNNGPVKMVIKNGVLMPKQKQRRYRTERPFACEHCSARFTLRSNMERHIKQQHPQQWAQRQRTGQHVIRGRGNSSNVISQISSSHLRNSSISVNNNNNNNMSSSNHFSAISDQVKYAILAQQLKARKDTDILQQALSQGSNVNAFNNTLNNNNNNCTSVEDDDPKLIIDEDDEEDEEDEDDDDVEDVICEEQKPQDLSNTTEVTANKIAAKKVAETILEQAIKAGNNLSKKCLNNEDRNATKDFELKIANTMIARAESVGKYLKEVAGSPFKDDQPDLVSVSKLVDNATIPLSFNNYFRPSDIANQMEQSDEEGLVASGSASDNNSGPEETLTNTNPDQKKKSAYSLAPNRVSCPYCQRMFPWSSSLRRHILTHTGQKPFKCSHCPLLFTTKSNCDRHLLRKHGNVESAVSLYVPIEDIPDPIPTPKAVAEAKAAAASAAAAAMLTTNEENELPKINSINLTSSVTAIQNVQKSIIEPPIITSADLPYKCHLCDSSFSERLQCLDHIKMSHVQEFALLLAKGAIDTEAELNNQILQSNDDDERRTDDGRGKYPDYANRKVICAFCVRRFWSTEDLRRHMRTHSGERPFQCEICLRKFTLKHSMLRHMKKHNGNHHNNMLTSTNSGSDISDDEQTPTNRQTNNITGSSNNNNNNMILANSLRNHKIHDILSKANLSWRNQMARFGLIGEHQKENIAFQQQQQHQQTVIKTEQNGVDDNLGTSNNGITTTSNSDLIGNLLGISDQGILNKLLSSADEAAKFLGIDK